MVEIVILGSRAKIRGELPQNVLEELDEVCAYQPEDYEYSKRYIEGSWNGWIHLFNKLQRSFPVGLISSIKFILELNSIFYTIKDIRQTSTPAPLKSNIVLRDYQERIVQRALEKKSGLIALPTGAGKTQIAIELTARIGLPTIFIAPTEEIALQTIDRFKQALNQEIGLIGLGKFEPKRITIATWQTLWNGIKKDNTQILDSLKGFEVFFFDEGDILGADEVYRVAQFCPARFRYALSATPFRVDRAELKMHGAVGDLIQEVTASDLVKLGYLVKPFIKFVKSKSMFFPRWIKWQKIYSQGVVHNKSRNELLAGEIEKLRDMGRTVLVLVTEIAHGKLLENLVSGSKFIHSSSKDRREVIENFKENKVPILISSPIVERGWDAPNITAMVLAGAGKSPVKAVQRIGRGLRPYNGKKDVRIIDVNDKGMRYLAEHSVERFKIYRSEPEFVIEGDVPDAI
ncbi:MAG: DEAD/DEAH box helicase [Halobacteria archaeon]